MQSRVEKERGTKRIRGSKLQRIRQDHLRASPLCVICAKKGRVTVAVEVDHITPLYKGGAEHPDNRQSLCKACHAEKTNEDMGHVQRSGSDANGLPTRWSHHWNT